MKGHSVDITSMMLVVLGGLSEVYSQAVALGLPSALDLVYPGRTGHIMAIIGLVSLVAGILLKSFFNRTSTHTVEIPTTNGSTVTIATVNPPVPTETKGTP